MTIRYDCVLPSADHTRLLLVRDGDRWALPSVVCSHAWLATAVEQICTEFRELYCIDVFVLRILQWLQSGIACELEALAGVANHNAQWVDLRDPIVKTLTAGETAVIRNWSEDRGYERRLSPWQRRGWLDEARSWIAAQVPGAGALTQVKAGWNGSCVLRVAAPSETLYFKASPPRLPGEAAVIRALAEDWPDHVPELVAADDSRRWMLMREIAGGPVVEDDQRDLADVACLMARIQIDRAPHAARWLELGCEDRGLGTIRAHLDMVLVDIPQRLHAAGVITESECADLAAFVPVARDVCDALAAFAVPSLTIHHEDFRPDNARRTPQGTLILVDWNETVLSHPFFTLHRFLWFMPARAYALRRTLRDAYLEAFTLFEPPDRLRDAFDLSTRLAPLYDAYRFAKIVGDVDALFARGLDDEERRNARRLMEHMLEVCG